MAIQSNSNLLKQLICMLLLFVFLSEANAKRHHNTISFDLNTPATDPQFVAPGNSATADFHLESGSPAINSGTTEFGTAKTNLDGKIWESGKINKGVN